jgi:hypothetical protein
MFSFKNAKSLVIPLILELGVQYFVVEVNQLLSIFDFSKSQLSDRNDYVSTQIWL